jgi:hypothetical protein
MNAKRWTLVATLAVVALVGAAMIVPLAFAQSPTPDTSPSFGIEQNLNGMFGRGSGMMGRMNTSGFAANPMMMGRGQGAGFMDADGNGVCDNFVDADGDGVCDLAGTGRGQGNGPGFVDKDGDGVCDNFVDADGDGVCDLRGTGQGNGPGFVDEDGDGVCDHAAAGGQQGMMRRGGRSQMMGGWGQQQQFSQPATPPTN